MKRIKYIPQKDRWSDLESLISTFQKLGGKPPLLLHLLKNSDSHPIFFIPDTNLKFHTACHAVMLRAATILEQTGFGQQFIDATMLCASIHLALVKCKKGLVGNPVQCRRYYWVGALLPYLQMTTGTKHWRWLEGWLNLVEPSNKESINSLRISIPKTTNFLKDPNSTGSLDAKTQQKLIRKSLLLGIQAGIAGLKISQAIQEPPKRIVEEITKSKDPLYDLRPKPKHYRLMRNMCQGRSPEILQTKNVLDLSVGRLMNILIPDRPSRLKPKRATRGENAFYKEAYSLWPGLEPGLKAIIAQAGIIV